MRKEKHATNHKPFLELERLVLSRPMSSSMLQSTRIGSSVSDGASVCIWVKRKEPHPAELGVKNQQAKETHNSAL